MTRDEIIEGLKGIKAICQLEATFSRQAKRDTDLLIWADRRKVCEAAIKELARRADGWAACGPGNMPEDDDAVHKYKDSHMELCTVIVCERYQDSERFIVSTANRLNVKPTGTPYLDKQCTDGWVWSNGHQNITHWRPLPAPPSEGL